VNAPDILKYGHQTVLRAIEDMPDAWWEMPGACGTWSIKDVLAHLTSHELVAADVMNSFLDGGPTPYLDLYQRPDFNDSQVVVRSARPAQAVLEEYLAAYAQVAARIIRLTPETLRQPGTLPWYGTEYALDDYLVYGVYGHKREHTAQIGIMRDHLTA
jgi:hypothetical protein